MKKAPPRLFSNNRPTTNSPEMRKSSFFPSFFFLLAPLFSNDLAPCDVTDDTPSQADGRDNLVFVPFNKAAFLKKFFLIWKLKT